MNCSKKFIIKKEPKMGGTSEIPYPFSPGCTYSRHLYYRDGDVIEVVFENKLTGEKKIIFNNQGEIVHFPGIVKEEDR